MSIRNVDKITSPTMHHSFRPPLFDLKSQKYWNSSLFLQLLWSEIKQIRPKSVCLLGEVNSSTFLTYLIHRYFKLQICFFFRVALAWVSAIFKFYHLKAGMTIAPNCYVLFFQLSMFYLDYTQKKKPFFRRKKGFFDFWLPSTDSNRGLSG